MDSGRGSLNHMVKDMGEGKARGSILLTSSLGARHWMSCEGKGGKALELSAG